MAFGFLKKNKENIRKENIDTTKKNRWIYRILQT